MYIARIFSEGDSLITSYIGPLCEVIADCEKHFLDFDSTTAISCYLNKLPLYAKAYQGVKQVEDDGSGFLVNPFRLPDLCPAFVHISPLNRHISYVL